jgi:hypothetical protein
LESGVESLSTHECMFGVGVCRDRDILLQMALKDDLPDVPYNPEDVVCYSLITC